MKYVIHVLQSAESASLHGRMHKLMQQLQKQLGEEQAEVSTLIHTNAVEESELQDEAETTHFVISAGEQGLQDVQPFKKTLANVEHVWLSEAYLDALSELEAEALPQVCLLPAVEVAKAQEAIADKTVLLNIDNIDRQKSLEAFNALLTPEVEANRADFDAMERSFNLPEKFVAVVRLTPNNTQEATQMAENLFKYLKAQGKINSQLQVLAQFEDVNAQVHGEEVECDLLLLNIFLHKLQALITEALPLEQGIDYQQMLIGVPYQQESFPLFIEAIAKHQGVLLMQRNNAKDHVSEATFASAHGAKVVLFSSLEPLVRDKDVKALIQSGAVDGSIEYSGEFVSFDKSYTALAQEILQQLALREPVKQVKEEEPAQGVSPSSARVPSRSHFYSRNLQHPQRKSIWQSIPTVVKYVGGAALAALSFFAARRLLSPGSSASSAHQPPQAKPFSIDMRGPS